MKIFRESLTFLLIIFSTNAFSVDFTLFGDVIFMDTNSETESTTFNLGGFNLTANQEIGEATAVNSEIVFEDAGHGFEVDVERFAITRTFNPMFNFAAGRFHTPLGMWNQYFHHGSLLQDTISRPFFLEFEDAHGGIYPNHLVGLMLTGESETISYQFGYGNSNGINTVGAESHPEETALEVINNRDPSDEKSLVIRGAYKPKFFLDEIGIFYMHNHIVELGEPDDIGNVPFVERGQYLFEQKIFGFDLRYNGDKIYHLFEFFNATYKDNLAIVDPGTTPLTPNPDSYSSYTFYYQLGYRLTEKLSLVGRFESMDYDADSTYFQLLHTLPEDRYVFAVNYKLQESNAVRFEFSQASIEGEDNVSSIAVQWFFILL